MGAQPVGFHLPPPPPPPQANPNELTNGVINSAFMLLFKDSIRLFAAYNEGVINLLGNALTLN